MKESNDWHPASTKPFPKSWLLQFLLVPFPLLREQVKIHQVLNETLKITPKVNWAFASCNTNSWHQGKANLSHYQDILSSYQTLASRISTVTPGLGDLLNQYREGTTLMNNGCQGACLKCLTSGYMKGAVQSTQKSSLVQDTPACRTAPTGYYLGKNGSLND